MNAIDWSRVKPWQNTRLTRHIGQRANDDEDYPRREDYLTGVVTKISVSERGDLDMGEAEDGGSDAPTDVAKEMVMAVIPIPTETAGATIFEPVVRNENGKQGRRCEAPVTALDWRSRIQRAEQQQAREVAQLHRTIAKMAIMLDAQIALQEAQWQGMETWLEKREEKWDEYHQDDVLWGRGISDVVTRVVAATHRGQIEERKADTDGAGLEASIHAETMQTGGPEKPEDRQQLQPGG